MSQLCTLDFSSKLFSSTFNISKRKELQCSTSISRDRQYQPFYMRNTFYSPPKRNLASSTNQRH